MPGKQYGAPQPSGERHPAVAPADSEWTRSRQIPPAAPNCLHAEVVARPSPLKQNLFQNRRGKHLRVSPSRGRPAAAEMGCCSSRSSDSPASRVTRWRSTGIVALRDAKLKVVPQEVLQVGNSLRTLDLTNNKIVEVPQEVGTIVNMQRLVLAGNLIENIPANIGYLRNLKILTLDRNRITVLPEELGSLSNLQQLTVSQNSLLCLPKSVGDLCNMLLLNVSDNKLNALPESIGGCKSLEELQANGNTIEDVPSSICNLACLKSISLNGNKIRQLPPNLLKDCKALQNLSLHSNPISMDQFQQMDGFGEFEARRRKKFDKQIDSNVMMGSTALDEGIDLR
ncbi:hypothetical protein CFC21_112704 [Triticum aestivum]|uniref:Disease resistance R13L4/SHOC-2-like LRR domain-containing protein n=2 Tax=Triticum aestivum TaxID=4565 RepID=A0A3B6HNG8_WHEAT|nr:plant intracellular Ras-group-related LRR protein 7-like [Triticum dicoccoides]XP_044362562.1 plant intracellular Ras-group-related LRR protein 7-like [Triticum aestivum]MBC2899886.1 hypothetical protein [Triticum aestivum]